MLGEDADDDGAGKTLGTQTAERRDDIEGNASQSISIGHIYPTFRMIMDTCHDQILT